VVCVVRNPVVRVLKGATYVSAPSATVPAPPMGRSRAAPGAAKKGALRAQTCLDPLSCRRSADVVGLPTGRAIIRTGSGSLPVVLVDESAEEIAALDLARLGAEDPEGW
jgi:hypothetical protein